MYARSLRILITAAFALFAIAATLHAGSGGALLALVLYVIAAGYWAAGHLARQAVREERRTKAVEKLAETQEKWRKKNRV